MDSHFNDNPFADEAGFDEPCVPPLSATLTVPPRDPDASQPVRKRSREASGEAPPFIGYSLADPDEAEDAADALAPLLARVAEAEATLRQSAQEHRFRLALAAREREALGAALRGRREALAPAARRDGAGESGRRLAALVESAAAAAEGRAWAARGAWIRRALDAAPGEDSPHQSDGEMAEVTERVEMSEVCDEGEAVEAALAELLPTLDVTGAAVVHALAQQWRACRLTCHAIRNAAAGMEQRAQRLQSAMRQKAATQGELVLLAAQSRWDAALDAARDAPAMREILRKRRQLQQELRRAETAMTAVMMATNPRTATHAGSSSSSSAQQQQQQEAAAASSARLAQLEDLEDRLALEVLCLRQTVRSSVSPSIAVALSAPWNESDAVAADGRMTLRKHSCAMLMQQLADVTQEATSALLCRTITVCPETTEQLAQLSESRATSETQRNSINAFLMENAWLHGQATSDTAELTDAASEDPQAPFVDAFTSGLQRLVEALNTQLSPLAELAAKERAACATAAFYLRATQASDFAQLAEHGVAINGSTLPVCAAAVDDLDGADVHLDAQQCIALRPLPSLADIREAVATQMERAVAVERENLLVAKEALAERRAELEWWRQQSPAAAIAELREVREELAKLHKSMNELPPRDVTPLRVEQSRCEERLAQLRQALPTLRMELEAAEEEWRRLEAEDAENDTEETEEVNKEAATSHDRKEDNAASENQQAEDTHEENEEEEEEEEEIREEECINEEETEAKREEDVREEREEREEEEEAEERHENEDSGNDPQENEVNIAEEWIKIEETGEVERDDESNEDTEGV